MKVKIELKNSYKADSREFLTALMNNESYCKLLQTESTQKPYEKLLNWMIAYSASMSSTEEFPALKEIYKLAGIPYSHIGSYLRDIYYDICKFNTSNSHKFKQRKQNIYFLRFFNFEFYAQFYLGLDDVPRVGDEFKFGFIKPTIGAKNFWVKKINHEIYDGIQVTSIDLTVERPNLYKDLLMEKAFLNGQLDWWEYFGNVKVDPIERLLKLYKNL